jgi:hypothetical protein
MADYYPVLARAVSGLSNSDAKARQELYARARTIVIEHMRNQNRQESAPETRREQAALESAIRRVEAETFSQARVSKDTSLGKILQALQVGEAPGAALEIAHRARMNGAKPALNTAALHTAPLNTASPKPSGTAHSRKTNVSSELGGVLNSLGAMMLVVAYVVAATAFTGVLYIRGAVWVAKGSIGYPILHTAMMIVVCLLIALPIMLFRKASPLPTVGLLLRLVHSASRRVF